MDVFLLGSSLGLSAFVAPTCLLQQHQHLGNAPTRKWSPLSISLGLSLSLFALSVLEAAPSNWLVIFDNRLVANPTATDDGSSTDDNPYLNLVAAYFVILTLQATYVLLICPSMAGVMVLDRMFHLPDCNLLCCLPKEKPWWLKLITGTLSLVYKAILMLFSIVFYFLHTCFRRRGTSMQKKDSGMHAGLPLTTKDDEAVAGGTRRVSIHCLMTSCCELLLLRGGIFLVGSMLGIAVTLIALNWLAPFIIEPKSMENWLAVGVCWMTSIGVVLSQLVNGFGSVSMPHSCLAGLYLDPIRQETVTKATIDLEKTQESLQARKQKLTEMRWKQVSPASSISPTNISNNATKTSRWSMGGKRTAKRTFSSIGEEVAQQKKKLLQEIAFLETLVEEMQEDLDDMKYTQQMEAESRTTMGRIKSWLGVVFSLILLVRLYFAGIAIWRHWYSDMDYGEQTKKDPVTTALLWAVGHHMVTEREYNELSQFISLLLTAILSVSQIRTFLRTIAAIHRRANHLFCSSRTSARLTPRSDSTAGAQTVEDSTPFQTRKGVYMHILAALMGSYFLACIVMTKAMLPWQYRASFSGALGGLDAFVVQQDVITALFAMSAVASAIVLALLFGMQRSNAVRHNVSWMDDLTSPNRDLDV